MSPTCAHQLSARPCSRRCRRSVAQPPYRPLPPAPSLSRQTCAECWHGWRRREASSAAGGGVISWPTVKTGRMTFARLTDDKASRLDRDIETCVSLNMCLDVSNDLQPIVGTEETNETYPLSLNVPCVSLSLRGCIRRHRHNRDRFYRAWPGQ